jgi:site-specific DNA-methyltransferase (adenine-specific)
VSIQLLNCDCMEYMESLPVNAFDLAIVDPPYGIERFQKKGSVMLNAEQMGEWDKNPGKEYFWALMRISRNQIIWGGNYFDLPPSKHFIFWHKLDAAPSFASGELAWASYDKPAAYWSSAIEKSKIHPTQKPIKLYSWLLETYAKPGQRILDTHLGSGSSAIAAHYFGCDFVGCEIDKDYYDAAVKRFNNETAQEALF